MTAIVSWATWSTIAALTVAIAAAAVMNFKNKNYVMTWLTVPMIALLIYWGLTCTTV